MKIRAELDAIAWHTIHPASVVRDQLPYGYDACLCRANYTELDQTIQDTGGIYDKSPSRSSMSENQVTLPNSRLSGQVTLGSSVAFRAKYSSTALGR